MEIRSFAQNQRPANAFILVLLCLLLTCMVGSSDGASLAPDERNALKEIAKELKKHDWNFSRSVDPCRGDISWISKNYSTYANELHCNLFGSVYHVANITLKGQDLAGVLPKSLANLTQLTMIDLTRNYLTGSIPSEWASMASLAHVSLGVNQLSGSIPKHLVNMTRLNYLNIENNMFSGPVPAELGKLVNLTTLILSTNNLSGQLPKTLTRLSDLVDLRISSNNFSGMIPDYFQSWRSLKKLEIQGSGFKGPIPPTISHLTNLFELRISDLDGEGSDFPNLTNMKSLKHLVLRNCKISGPIQPYLAKLISLKTLDLSFNNLEGRIPDEFQGLKKLDHMYLTRNMLSGSIPEWIKTTGVEHYRDLSYNNFSEDSVPTTCNNLNLNFFRSTSRKLDSHSAACLKNFPCSNDHYSLHINCGGDTSNIGRTTYEEDSMPGGPALFNPTKTEWGFSSTGAFLKSTSSTYIEINDSVLPVTDAELYTEARTSAISLTYYGRCLAQGNYTVVLYFAELKFWKNNSFHRLGRRIFDVYVQEKLVLRDFDIVKAANGAEKACNRTFNNISVPDGTIEIRFYYAGKGTTAVPDWGTYGPLISAISVESVLRGIDLQTGFFTYHQLKAATNNFDPANKIGEGGFGSVYRGTLLDATHIAVKRLSSKSSQGNKEFVTEIGMISGLHHPNLVRLYGCCVEGSQLFLVYEYMVNNNLARALFDEDWPLGLDWPARQKVCFEVAKGLVFLHEESAIRIVHRDIKPTNVLLDENLNAKISDFGLARLREEEDTHISTRIAGTRGYMSPEYALWGYLTYKADVYSFGVVALEIVAGRSNMDFVPDEQNFCLLDWAVVQQRLGNVMGIVDAKLGNNYNKEEAVRMIKIAFLCTNATPALRPTMSQVVSMLEGNLTVDDSTIELNAYGWMAQLPVSRPELTGPAEVISETQSLIHSSDAPLKDSSSK